MELLNKLNFGSKTDSESDPQSEPQFAQDPEPGERPAPRRGRAKATPAAAKRPAPTTAKLAKEVGEDLAGLLEMGAAVWGMSDDCCAPVLEENAKPIAEALTGILARNPRLLAKFADANVVSFTLQFAAFGKALKPVAVAIYRNHIAETDKDQPNAADRGFNLSNFPPFSHSHAA